MKTDAYLITLLNVLDSYITIGGAGRGREEGRYNMF